MKKFVILLLFADKVQVFLESDNFQYANEAYKELQKHPLSPQIKKAVLLHNRAETDFTLSDTL